MHRKCFFSNKIYKKACNIGCRKIVSITKYNEKNCLKCITLQKKLSASPKNGNPPIKNNGPSLTKEVTPRDTKLVSKTTFNVEVEIRPNRTSLILPIVSSF